MNNQFVLGVDVSAKKLDLYSTEDDTYIQLENSLSSIYNYLKKFVEKDILILYEATWAYSSTLLKVCNDLWLYHFQVHPVQFAQACKWLGKMEKNDKLDAKAIACIWSLMLNHMGRLTIPSTNDTKQLQSYLSSIESLKRLMKKYVNLIHKTTQDAFTDQSMIQFYKSQHETLANEIKRLTDTIEARLLELWFEEKLRHLQSIPSIGKETSLYLLLFFIDLSEKWLTVVDKWKVTAFAWLNPINMVSWSSVSKAKISKKWRSVVRWALYMPCLNRYKLSKVPKYAETNMWEFFIRMKDKFESWANKRWRSVVTAMMRKTLLVAWSLFCTNTEYKRS
jgi:transposase